MREITAVSPDIVLSQPDFEIMWSWFWWPHLSLRQGSALAAALDPTETSSQTHKLSLSPPRTDNYAPIDPAQFTCHLFQTMSAIGTDQNTTITEIFLMARGIRQYNLWPVQSAVLIMAARGFTQERTANTLGVSTKDIQGRTNIVLAQLHAASSVGAVITGLQEHIIPTSVINPALKNGAIGLGLLTPAETKVAILIKEGYSYQQIAQLLSVSKKTIEKHVDNASDKIKGGTTEITHFPTQMMLALVAFFHGSPLEQVPRN